MKTPSPSNVILLCGLTLCVSLALWFPDQAQSADPSDMAAQCRELKDLKQKMQADMQGQATQLAAHVETMDRAPREEKLERLATLVTGMAEQQTYMNVRKAKIDDETIRHLMQHMHAGKESLAQCPLMKAPEPKTGTVPPAKQK